MGHNYYREPGGEDESFHAEKSLLIDNGHQVITFVRSNDSILENGLTNKIRLFSNVIWSRDNYREIVKLIKMERPQVAHFQNIFPLISPSSYYACKEEGIPVVQTLRNYRLICSNGYFLRSGRVCEDCMGKKFPWPGVVHACYRNSRPQTMAVASMLYYHRMKDTWESRVDLYISLSEFSRSKFIESGLSPEKIVVKPNYISDPGLGGRSGQYIVFAGRLSGEKGIETFVRALKRLPNVKAKILGEGPLGNPIHKYVAENNIKADVLGRLPKEQVIEIIKGSVLLVFPSLLYETFGRTIIEAFACGVPVIASRLGAMAELIRDQETGLLFKPGDSIDLAEKINWLWNHPGDVTRLGHAARLEYEKKFTPERNYELLMDIYERVLAMQ